MSNRILKISFSRLKKQELKTLASRVIAIGEKYDPETLKIKDIFDLLVELQTQIDSLDLGYIAHPISEPLNVMRKQRVACAQGIIDRLKFIENGGMNGMLESLKVAKPIVFQHLKHLANYDDVKVYQNINSFLKLFNEDAKLQTATETLALTAYIDNLQSVNQSIEEQYGERREDFSKREKGATLRTVEIIKNAVEYYFKQIEVAAHKNQELDYKPLVDEVNKEIALTKAKLKARTSYYKNKADKVVDNVEVVGDQSGEPSEPIQTVSRMYPMSAETGNEDIFGEVDKKRTVAMPTKQTLLPDVSTEA